MKTPSLTKRVKKTLNVLRRIGRASVIAADVARLLRTGRFVAAAALLTAGSAAAQTTMSDPFTLTNLPSVITAGAASNVTTTPIRIRNNFGLSFFPYFAGTSAISGALVLEGQISYDGTNKSTTTPVSLYFGQQGTTAVRGFTNVPPEFLGGHSLHLTRITNSGNASVFLTNVVVVRPR